MISSPWPMSVTYEQTSYIVHIPKRLQKKGSRARSRIGSWSGGNKHYKAPNRATISFYFGDYFHTLYSNFKRRLLKDYTTDFDENGIDGKSKKNSFRLNYSPHPTTSLKILSTISMVIMLSLNIKFGLNLLSETKDIAKSEIPFSSISQILTILHKFAIV